MLELETADGLRFVLSCFVTCICCEYKIPNSENVAGS